jgi:hypothetical protein
MSEKTKATAKTKTFQRRKKQNPSTIPVSLDKADTVIEGGPGAGKPNRH